MDITVRCCYCNKDFIAHSTKAKWCSRKCKDTAFRIKHGIKCNINTEPYYKECIICGKEFDTFREAQKTCSHECAKMHQRMWHYNEISGHKKIVIDADWVKEKQTEFTFVSKNKSRITLKCKKCGNTIERDRSTVRRYNVSCEYCKEIEKLSDARIELVNVLVALKESKTPKYCECCNEEFYSVYPTQKYCSTKCKRKARQIRYKENHPEAYAESKRLNRHIKRAIKYNCVYEYEITLPKVIHKDNCICQICGKKCDVNDKSWGSCGPLYPSIDHIVPLSKGGSHTWDNVQLAHMICNSIKCDKVSV